jgi:isocitrate dehydrogenase kinase/phosphatase
MCCGAAFLCEAAQMKIMRRLCGAAFSVNATHFDATFFNRLFICPRFIKPTTEKEWPWLMPTSHPLSENLFLFSCRFQTAGVLHVWTFVLSYVLGIKPALW